MMPTMAESIVTGGGPESFKKEQFIWVNTMIGNVKKSIVGIYHAIKHKHLPRYLAEFYRESGSEMLCFCKF